MTTKPRTAKTVTKPEAADDIATRFDYEVGKARLALKLETEIEDHRKARLTAINAEAAQYKWTTIERANAKADLSRAIDVVFKATVTESEAKIEKKAGIKTMPVQALKKAVAKGVKETGAIIEVPAVPAVQPKEETTTMAAKKVPAKKAAKKVAKSAKPKTLNKCQCGCGGSTLKNFCPGHDARLVGMIKRGELKSLSAFQQTFAKNHGIKLGEAKKAAPKRSTVAA